MQFDSDKHEETRARIYYDATTEGKERIRINEFVEAGQQKTAMERLLLWDEVSRMTNSTVSIISVIVCRKKNTSTILTPKSVFPMI